jgi:hypothetical protein
MSIYFCEYCERALGHLPRGRMPDGRPPLYPQSSSGEVTLRFEDGVSYTLPEMALHYVADHGWQPESTFVEHVMSVPLVREGGAVLVRPGGFRIAYLVGDFVAGPVPEGFTERLESLLSEAKAAAVGG